MKKGDYDYVILSLIPEQVTYQSQDSWVSCSGLSIRKQSQDIDNHHSWVWDWNWAQNSILSLSLSLRFVSNHQPRMCVCVINKNIAGVAYSRELLCGRSRFIPYSWICFVRNVFGLECGRPGFMWAGVSLVSRLSALHEVLNK